MSPFLFELNVVEEHKGSSSTLTPTLSSYATFLFLALLQGHLKVNLGNRSHDGIFAYPLSLIPVAKISALLTSDSIRKNTAPSLALADRVISIAVKHHKD